MEQLLICYFEIRKFIDCSKMKDKKSRWVLSERAPLGSFLMIIIVTMGLVWLYSCKSFKITYMNSLGFNILILRFQCKFVMDL